MSFFQILESLFVFFLLVAWIWVVIGVISDVFHSKDLSGLAKGLWVLLIIAVPWLGVLSYLIVRGKGMEERGKEAWIKGEEERRNYIQGIAGISTADELSKLAELKDRGVLTDTEFEAQKVKLLG